MTDRACICLEHARQEAERRKHPEACVTHLLLGMLKEAGGLACSILRGAKVDLEVLRDRIENCLVDSQDSDGRPEISSALKVVLELAQEEAALMGQTYVGTEHLLLGLLRNSECHLAVMLNELGLSLEIARENL
ncbi:MAG: Clp protease N-terminal domain-containing protein, partial [Planctomycetota bacterium]|nr:Clp protease N-terminal domain-containing protein [Planctomycetota bacterium]